MDYRDIIALVLFSVYSVFLIQRHLPGMIIWLALSYTLLHYLVKMDSFTAVTFSILMMHLLSLITNKTYENFEEEKKEDIEKGKLGRLLYRLLYLLSCAFPSDC